MKALIISGSPRTNGNTAHMAAAFCRGAEEAGITVDSINAQQANIRPCRGCLRCNLIKYCAIQNDDWPDMSRRIREADILVFATPIYFHHMSAPMKLILDRFRSFVRVRLTEGPNSYTPHEPWKKRFILFAAMGSSDSADAAPIIDLFTFMVRIMGAGNTLDTIAATRLAVNRQIAMNADELAAQYEKLGLSASLAADDAARNKAILSQCYVLGTGRAKRARAKDGDLCSRGTGSAP
ncbi:MAG: flavodoxin family protein [Spirochaetota bacterium]